MREKLFRGMRKDNGEWVEGFLFQTKDHTYIAYAEQFDDDLFLAPKNIFIEVIPETVGQFIGLTANGKKIFEGDIVAGVVYWLERPKNGLVAFRDGSFGLIWHRGEVEQFNPFTSMCNIEYVVIGNIHDNEELLEIGRGENEND